MHPFSAELLRQFPELKKKNLVADDEDLPYLMGNHFSDWLAGQAEVNLSSQLMDRVESFYKWCWDQPRGKSAEDDLGTIVTVSFLEKLFKHDELLPVIRRLLRKEDLLRNKNYFDRVGRERPLRGRIAELR